MRCKVIEGTGDNLKATVAGLGVRGKMDLGPVITTVQSVIDDIRNNGDKALLSYTAKFDGVNLETSEMRVTAEEIASAIEQTDSELLEVMKRAAANIRKFQIGRAHV